MSKLKKMNREFVAGKLRELAEELEESEQSFSSKSTAVNFKSGNLPSIFKLISIPRGSMILDYGGGSTRSQEIANDFLKGTDSEDLVYDPFNRTQEENQEILSKIRSHGGADISICSNVLNVVAEESARKTILKNIKKLTKSGAKVYFTVYEGDGSGKGKQTGKDQFQNNRKTKDYVQEIKEIFRNVIRKGKLIEAQV